MVVDKLVGSVEEGLYLVLQGKVLPQLECKAEIYPFTRPRLFTSTEQVFIFSRKHSIQAGRIIETLARLVGRCRLAVLS